MEPLVGAGWTAAVSLLLLIGPITPNAAEEPRRLECMACHAGAKRMDAGVDTGRTRSVTISAGDFRNGDHGKVDCNDCHVKGFDTFPHFRKKTETCMSCHPRKEEGAQADQPYDFDRIRREFEGTVHFTEFSHAKERCCGTSAEQSARPGALAPSGGTAAKTAHRFTCEHCHEPHYFKATERIKEPRLISDNDNAPCLRCHQDGATGPLADPSASGLIAAHRYLPHAQLHLDGTRCIDCHTTVTSAVTHDLPLGRGADQGCNTCHSIDSVLLGRLYRYVANTGSDTLGFNNSRMLQDGYVMGANRHRWTDAAAFLLMSLGLGLVLAHGGWRILSRRQGPRSTGSKRAKNEANGRRPAASRASGNGGAA